MMQSISILSKSGKYFCRASIILSFFSTLPLTLFSQPGTWASVYGGMQYDRGRGITQTFDKGYVVCGPTSSYGMGNTDVYLLKVDSAGKFQWHNTFGGINVENCY